MFRSLSTFVCIPAFAFLTGAALAQTPDGQTPVNEGVCDELMESGITKGLFGLCVAFCEAQDCDGDGGGELPGSCQHSAEKILANYDKRKQASDPDMPCIKAPCPCWSEEELDNYDPTGALRCSDDVDPMTSFHDMFSREQVDGVTVELQRFYVDNLPQQASARCFFRDFLQSQFDIRRLQNISTAEYLGCKADISALQDASGLTCTIR
jgi:hypothetical protein